MKAKEFYSVGIYLRLSREDIVDGKHSMRERHSIKEACSKKSGGSVNGKMHPKKKEHPMTGQKATVSVHRENWSVRLYGAKKIWRFMISMWTTGTPGRILTVLSSGG